jgi:hypothetical protein
VDFGRDDLVRTSNHGVVSLYNPNGVVSLDRHSFQGNTHGVGVLMEFLANEVLAGVVDNLVWGS